MDRKNFWQTTGLVITFLCSAAFIVIPAYYLHSWAIPISNYIHTSCTITFCTVITTTSCDGVSSATCYDASIGLTYPSDRSVSTVLNISVPSYNDGLNKCGLPINQTASNPTTNSPTTSTPTTSNSTTNSPTTNSPTISNPRTTTTSTYAPGKSYDCVVNTYTKELLTDGSDADSLNHRGQGYQTLFALLMIVGIIFIIVSGYVIGAKINFALNNCCYA